MPPSSARYAHIGASNVAVDPETGSELWQASGAFEHDSERFLVEFEGGAYAYAEYSGQIVDLDDGRVALRDCGWIGQPPQRTRSGLYRVECNRAVVLADLERGLIEPYASPNGGDVETPIPRWESPFDPGWHGPIDQTDDGMLALWFFTGESNSVALRSRERGEVWRVSVPHVPGSARIDAARRRVMVLVNGEEVTYDIRDGRELSAGVISLENRDDAPDANEVRIYDYTPFSERLPGEWHDLDVRASEDSSVVARYQVQVPAGGLRLHQRWGKSASLEGGARRLIVARQADGRILLERAMESGRTATGGYRTDLALAPDGRRVAVLPTDGVLRMYEVPSVTDSNN